MALITIKISDDDIIALDELARRCSEAEITRMTSHGQLSAERLMTMLAEDAAAVVRRPGSWEATTMELVLMRHGYEV